ncbi:MAG: replicative DNA helicase [Endozoicomonadaceae bacterium]|nr:replicative DNA helicase [Endozoicomonadaceae bacterium]
MQETAYPETTCNPLATLKTVPHSIEAEQVMLGSLMVDNQLWDVVADKLSSEDFYHQAHQKIFVCIASLAQDTQPFDPVTVSEALKNNQLLEACGGDDYLAQLVESIPSLSNAEAYASIVYERAVLRRLIKASQNIIQLAINPEGKSCNDIVESAERTIFQLTEQRNSDSGPVAIKPLLKSTLNRIDELFNSSNAITGLSSGFKDLDEMTSGLQPADMVVVAARPSMGKTVMGMNLVESAMLNSADKPVVVFSLEMPAEQILMRTLASMGKINQTRVRTGRLEDDDWPKLASAVKRLKEKKLFVDDTPGMSPQAMRSRLRRIVRQHGPLGLVMVDYLQLMQIADYKEGRINEISEISRSLKSMAKEFNVPMVALSQLNRSLEQRPNKRPVNSDLRESGAIEQDADLILFIYRDEVYNPDTEHKGIAEIIIGKQRNGPIGTVRLAFMGQYARFDDLSAQNWEGAE